MMRRHLGTVRGMATTTTSTTTTTSATRSATTTSATTTTPTDAYACARAWSALSAAHARVAERLTAALSHACGLSINDFEVLLRLDEVPPPGLRLGDLSPAVRLTQPSLSRMIARLAQHGWLTRTGDPNDGRGVLISLTPAGRDVLHAAVPVHAQTIRETLLDRLRPDEQDLLAAALTRITED
jgi:DNA-binding MarR family transcriptional regulator